MTRQSDFARQMTTPRPTIVASDLLGVIPFDTESQGTNDASVVQPFGLEYISKDWSFVAQFLLSHLELVEPLREMPAVVRDIFPGPTSIELAEFRDPEDGTCQLVASILTSLGVAEALVCLDALDETWWLAKAYAARDLIVTVDFRKHVGGVVPGKHSRTVRLD
jgi:hypothetical protein